MLGSIPLGTRKEVKIIAIQIVTDSTCDLSLADQEQLKITVLPLTVHFSNRSYFDGVDLSSEEFYQHLAQSEELPTTSQIAPQVFTERFQQILDEGDEVVGIFISGSISGTYQSASIAKEMLGSQRIHLVDSRSATMSLALLVSEAAKYRDAGHTAAEIAQHITFLAQKVRFIAAVNSLKYLRKGGRVSAASAVIGEVLGIKPLVSIIEGSVEPVGKVRGMQGALKEMLNRVMDDLPDLQYGVVFAHSCAPELAQKAIEYMKAPLKLTDWLTCNIGSVIGTYAGPGAVGLAYIGK